MVSMAAEPASPEPTPEMVGASSAPVTLSGAPTTARVALNAPQGPARLTLAATGEPRKVYLNIENITSTGRTTSYAVYLNPASQTDPHENKARLAGILPMFGVKEASDPNSEHGGSGLTYSLDVTNVVRELQAQGAWDPAHLNVTFAPRVQSTEKTAATQSVARPKADIKVGRVSLYYQ